MTFCVICFFHQMEHVLQVLHYAHIKNPKFCVFSVVRQYFSCPHSAVGMVDGVRAWWAQYWDIVDFCVSVCLSVSLSLMPM